MIYFNNNNSFPELLNLDEFKVIENITEVIHLNPLIAIDSMFFS